MPVITHVSTLELAAPESDGAGYTGERMRMQRSSSRLVALRRGAGRSDCCHDAVDVASLLLVIVCKGEYVLSLLPPL